MTDPTGPAHTSPRTQSGPARRFGTPAVILVLLVVLFTGPQFLSLGNMVLTITMLNLMAMAQAWNLIGGLGGQFSLGHGMFVALGGYSTVLILSHTGVPLWLAIVCAAAVTAAIGALAALPLLRLRGVYFSVGTLGVALAVQSWVINWKWAGQTAGVFMPSDAIVGFRAQYYFAAGLVVASTVIVAAALRTRFGLRLMAVRDDDTAAQELGVNAFAVKLAAFVVSAFLVGLCGALNAIEQLALEPYSAFTILWAVNMILACVIGGLSTSPGPLIGAALIFEMQQRLQGYQDLTPIIEGIVLLVIIRFAPGGIWGVLCAIPDALRGLRRRLGGGFTEAPSAGDS